MNNFKKFLLVMIILIIVGFIVFFIISNVAKQKEEETKNIEFNDENIYYNQNDVDDQSVMPTEFSHINNIDLAIEAYYAIKRIGVSAYSKDSMLGMLDDIYISYYNLNDENIEEKISKYKKAEYNIVDIECARYDSIFLCVLTTNNDEKFIYKYDELCKTYTIFLDDYISDIGYENITAENIATMINEIPKGSKYTVIDKIAHTNNEIIKFYAFYCEDFDNLYNKYISAETKEQYSYDQLKNLYNNEYSMFGGDNFNAINYEVKVNEFGLNDYNFKDSNGYRYTISEKSYFDFTIKIDM